MRAFVQKSILTFFLLLITIMMSTIIAQRDQEYLVITNKEGQFAVWSQAAQAPADWKPVKFKGSLKECSEYIEEVWTDMRPLSMQKKYKKNMKDGYVVVINHEEQYIIWPREEHVPEGWDLAGAGGSYDDCRTYIEEVWTDMRPLSLRTRLNE